jgi:hypothetical protein
LARPKSSLRPHQYGKFKDRRIMMQCGGGLPSDRIFWPIADIGLGGRKGRVKEQDLDNLGGKYGHYKFEI